jgi:hypothetical protein
MTERRLASRDDSRRDHIGGPHNKGDIVQESTGGLNDTLALRPT